MTKTIDIPDRYEDPRLIGRGGMGDIWLVRDTELDREVVLKLLRPGMDPGVTKRFRREALVAARLSGHPNVVTIFDVGEHDDQPYIVMEHVPGGTIADQLREGDVDQARSLRWLREAAEAIDAAHEAGVVHRDIKPGNLLLDSAGSVRVADFGIARALDAGSVTHTSPGTVLGSAGYLSPEQARGEQVGPASDRYALAVVAFELLSGKRPYERESFASEAAAHVNERIPSLRAIVANRFLPASVDGVFRRALAKPPEDRFDTASDFVDALERALHAPVPAETMAIGPAASEFATVVLDRQRSAIGIVRDDTRRATRWYREANAPWKYGLPAAIFLFAILLLSLGEDQPGTRQAATADRASRPATTQATEDRAPVEAAEPVLAADDPEPVAEERPPVDDEPAAMSQEAAIELHEAAWQLILDGRYAEALPMSRRALANLGGVSPWEAYANYNVGFSLLRLGRCAEAVPYLDRSEQLQGSREEIDVAQAEAAACSSDGRDGGPGKGDGRGKGKGKDKD